MEITKMASTMNKDIKNGKRLLPQTKQQKIFKKYLVNKLGNPKVSKKNNLNLTMMNTTFSLELNAQDRCCQTERQMLSNRKTVAVKPKDSCCQTERQLLSNRKTVAVKPKDRCCQTERQMLSNRKTDAVKPKG